MNNGWRLSVLAHRSMTKKHYGHFISVLARVKCSMGVSPEAKRLLSEVDVVPYCYTMLWEGYPLLTPFSVDRDLY